MASYAWVLEVRPGYEEAYKQRHDEIWPEMLAALRAAGIRNYNIFRHGLTLFGYFETDDLAAAQAALAIDPVNARWGASMAGMMKIEVDPATGFPFLLPRQFHMD
jgi:L-rhamnose mutarotase